MKHALHFPRIGKTLLAAALVAMAGTAAADQSLLGKLGGIFGAPAEAKTTAANSEELNEALVDAAGNGDLNEVKRLLAAGAEINQRTADSYGWPLLRALTEEHMEVARYLLENGADPNAVDDAMEFCGGAKTYQPWTALSTAVFSNREDIVQLLLEKGANIKTCPDDEGEANPAMALRAAIHVAKEKGDTRMLRLLLEKGANVACTSCAGDSEGNALHFAKLSKNKAAINLVSQYSKKGAKKRK